MCLLSISLGNSKLESNIQSNDEIALLKCNRRSVVETRIRLVTHHSSSVLFIFFLKQCRLKFHSQRPALSSIPIIVVTTLLPSSLLLSTNSPTLLSVLNSSHFVLNVKNEFSTLLPSSALTENWWWTCSRVFNKVI